MRRHCSSVTVLVEVEITGLRRASGHRVVVQKQVRLLKGNGDIVQEGRGSSLVYIGAEHGDSDNFGDAP